MKSVQTIFLLLSFIPLLAFGQEKTRVQQLDSLFEKAKNYNTQGQYDSAMILIEYLIDEYSTMNETEKLFEAYYWQGYVNYYHDDNDAARIIFNEYLEKCKSTLGENHKLIAYFLRGQGLIHEDLAELDQADIKYQAARAVFKEAGIENDQMLGIILMDLGDVANRQDKEWDALAYYEEAKEVLLTVSGRENVRTAGAYSRIGDALEGLGEFYRAEIYYNESIRIMEGLYGTDDPSMVRDYNLAGGVFVFTDRLDQALEYFQKAYDISRNLEESDVRNIFSTNNMGWVYLNLEELEKAIEYSTEAVRLKQEYLPGRKISLASSHQNLAMALFKNNQFEEAESSFNSSIEIANSALGPKNSFAARCYSFLAKIYYEYGDLDRALAYVELSMDANFKSENSFNIENPEMTKSVNDNIYNDEGFNRSMQVAVDIQYTKTANPEIESLNRIIALTELRLAMLNEARAKTSTRVDRRELSSSFHDNHKRGINVAWSAYQLTQDSIYLNKMWEYSTQSKSQLLRLLTNEERVISSLNISIETIKKQKQLLTQIDSLTSIVEDVGDSFQVSDPIWQDLLRANESLDSLSKSISASYPGYNTLLGETENKSISEIQEGLEPKQAILDFFESDSTVFIGVVTFDNFQMRSAVFHQIEDEIESLNQAIINRTDQFEEIAESFFNKLIDPVSDLLSEKSELTFITSGHLSFLPFEILIDPKSDKMLIEKYVISNEASLPSSEKSIKAKTNGQFLAVAPGSTDGSNGQLKFHREEASMIASLFSGKALIGNQSTKHLFKQSASEYAVLHLATHATLNPNFPDQSGLVFYDSLGNEELMNAYEIYNLDLQADLVTLSACNTGIGKIEQGEGAISLARAFAFAGCSNIVMSLWEVNDQSTNELMTYFYTNLKKGLPKNEALRQAKLEFVAKADPVKAHPFYWAGFVFSGDPTPIKLESAKSYSNEILLALVFLLLSVLIIYRRYSIRSST